MAADVRGSAYAAGEAAALAQSISTPNPTQVSAQASLVSQNLETRANVSAAARAATQLPDTKTPVYDKDGNVTGYNIITYDEFGNPQPAKFQANPILPTGPLATGPTGPSAQNAAQMLTAQFISYGLTGDIAAGIVALKQGGLDDLTIESILKSPDPQTVLKAMNLSAGQISAATNLVNSWNTRFSGNVLREKAGLPPLDPATYIANEDSYKQVMVAAGLPTAVITTDAIGKVMAMDVSPAEVQKRINAAYAVVNNEDPYTKQALQQQFGLTTGDMVLHVLDPNTAANVIQTKVTAAQIGGEAFRSGLGVPMSYAEQLAAAGVTQTQAAAGFQNIAQQLPGTQSLATRYAGYGAPETIGQSLEAATFGTPTQAGETPAQAEARLKRLQTQEASAFGGSAGADTKGQSLGISNAQGVS